MGGLLRGLVIATSLVSNLLVADAIALSMNSNTNVTCQEFAADRSFRPTPPGVPQRRLSGGTR